MRRLFIYLVFLTLISCKYKESKATYSIIEVDTIAIDGKVLKQNQDNRVEIF